MKRRKVLNANVILLIILLISALNSNAQISAGGVPRGYSKSTLKSSVAVPSFSTMKIDAEKLLKEDLLSPIPKRFSVFEDVAIDIRQLGVEIDLPQEQGRIWLYTVESKDAHSVQLFFRNFLLPDGAELFISNQDYSIVHGAFTSENNNPKNQLMIADLLDKHITIEYFEPYNAAFEGLVELGSIGLAYKDLLGKKSLVDPDGFLHVNVPESEEWQNEKHSVCKITFKKGGSGFLCTGGLLNNSRSDGTPYFLTADHCVDNEEVAGTVVAYFHYEYYGGSEELNVGKTLSGASLLKNNAETDFALLLLNKVPHSAHQAYYAAWDATNSQDSTSVGIHHPHGWPKRLSISEKTTISYAEEISWEGGSVTPPDSHWEVLFDRGTTAGGSSGSPLFNTDKHQVVGQLHGGSEEDYYGKFSLSYIFDDTNDISQYLDPDNQGLEELTYGYYPAFNLPDPHISPELKKVCSGVPVQLTGMSAFDPISWKWSFTPSTVTFTDGTDRNSKNPVVLFDSDGLYGVTLEVGNAAGTTSRWFPESISVGDDLAISIQPYALEDSCLLGFDSIQLEAYGAKEYLWQFTNLEEENFYFVNDTVNPVTIKKSKIPTESLNLSISLLGSHGSCSQEKAYNMLLSLPSNDSIHNAIQVFPGKSMSFSNKCASIEENEPIPPITSCTGNSWCDEFGTGEDIIANSVWFYFIPDETRKYRIESNGMDNQIAIYKAESVQALLDSNYVLMGANDDASASDPLPVTRVELIAGEKYLIQVDGSAGNISGNFTITIGFAAGIEANILPGKETIKIYPLPLKDFIQAEHSAFESSKLIVAEVYDISGSQIQTAHYENPARKTIEINSANWSSGIYFIRFNVDNVIYTEKLVKF